MARRLLGLVGIMACLSACSLDPDYRRPDAPVADHYPGADSATLSPGQAAANIGWRDFFQDARLRRLVEIAQVERAGLFPTVDANFDASRNHGGTGSELTGLATYNSFLVDASVAWQIDLFGRVGSLSRAALDQYLATAEARRAVQLSLVAQVANQYLTVLAYDDQLKVTLSALDIAQESFRITQLSFDTGAGSELDLREAEGALETARGQLAAQQRLRAQAENALVLLIGEPIPDDLPPGTPLESQTFLEDIPPGLPSDLLNRRPDILQAERQLQATNASIGAARAAFFPSISLTGLDGAGSLQLGNLFKPGTGQWSIGPSITLPIFTGGLNSANLAAAKAEREVAVAQYEKSIQTAFREVADGLVARSTYDDQAKAADRLVVAQRRRFDLSELRYKNGVDSYLTVLTAQTDLNTSELSRVSVHLARLNNLVNLYQALGGGWVEHGSDVPRPAEEVD